MCCNSLSKKILGKVSERVLTGLNLFACLLMLASIAVRFYYLAVSEYDGRSSTVFFVLLSFYQVVLISLLAAAEFKRERPRLYLDFLDNKFGRAGTIIFIELVMLDTRKAAIIIMAIVIFAIGVFGLVAGWSQGPDGIKSGANNKTSEGSQPSPSKKADRESAAPSS